MLHYANLKVVKRQNNFGLKRNIIEGMSEISRKYSNDTMVVFLEDDLRLDKDFVTVIDALEDRYDWDHVNLWCPLPPSKNHDVIAYNCGFMLCWGWVSRITVLKEFLSVTYEDTKYSGRTFIHDYFGLGLLGRQLRLNKKGRLNTWAVYWAIFLINNRKNIIGFDRSFVINEGLVGGTNCNNDLMQKDERKKLLGAEVRSITLATKYGLVIFRTRLFWWFLRRMGMLVRHKILLKNT